MSEYELSLLRQRRIAALDSKALRGELRFILPPGYYWNEIGQIEVDPDVHVSRQVSSLAGRYGCLAFPVPFQAPVTRCDSRSSLTVAGAAPA